MILRTSSKLVCYRGRSGKSYAVAALAVSSNKSQKEGAEAHVSDGVSPSEAPKIKGKKISKAKRRAIVDDFVLKYKAMNGGKLPHTSHVVKEVGGSYYVVKKILQEMEYQLNPPSANNANQNTIAREIVNEDGCLYDTKVILTSTIPVNASIENDTRMVVTNDVEINDTSGKHIEAERGSEYSSSAEKLPAKEAATVDCSSDFSAEQSSVLKRDGENILDSSHEEMDKMEAKGSVADFNERPNGLLREKFDNVSQPCHENSETGGLKEALANGDNTVSVTEKNSLHVVDTERVSHPGLENVKDNKQKDLVSEELQSKDGSKDKTEHDEGTPKRKPAGYTSNWRTSEAELTKSSTLWGTLKSFADGIINIWRKS